MDYYTTLKNKVANHIIKDEIKENDKVINAYTLCTILEKESKKLINFKERHQDLLDTLNSYFDEPIIIKKGLFKKEVKYVPRYSRLEWEINDKSMKISMHGRPGYNDNEDTYYSVYLQKDLGYDDIFSPYSKSDMTEEMFRGCKEYIDSAFNTLEYFAKIYDENKTDTGYTQIINEGDMSLKISWNLKRSFDVYSDNAGFKYDVSLNENADPNNHQRARFYNDKRTIKEFIDDYKVAILKNMPIKIDRLNPFFRYLAISNLKEKEKVIKK